MGLAATWPRCLPTRIKKSRCAFPIDDRWLKFSTADLELLALDWLDELRGEVTNEKVVSSSVTWMGFTAPPELQWNFIMAAVRFASTDEELGHIAAGPMECLLSRYGADVIDRFEERARLDSKFARAMTGVWRHLMSDDVWQRVATIQSGVSDPLN